jgi:hypothetical protein
VAGTYCCWLTNQPDIYRVGLPFGGLCAGASGWLPTGDRPSLDLDVDDLNGDGIDDLVTPWRGVTIGLGDGRGGFGSRQEFPISAYRIEVADVNNDAKPDVLLLQGGHVAVLLNQSSRPTLPEAPGHVTARPGDASIVLTWDPVEHPDLAGYRIRYGLGDGTVLAGADVSTIDVPVDQTSATVSCLPESTVRARVTAVDRWGRESECAPLVSARPGPAGGEFSFVGEGLHSGSRSPWIMGLIELDAAPSAADIVPGTVTMNGVGPAQALAITDRDHDGRKELMVRFPRAAVDAAGTTVRAHVEGRVAGCRDTLRFAVDDSVRIGRPGARPQSDESEDPAVTDRPVTAFALHAAVPSPAHEGCTIAFDLPVPALVRLKVFDLRGRLVSTVLEREMPGGAHRLWWARQALPDGVYFASIEAGAFKAVRRIVLLR